jgi:hypothetical protein
MLTVTRFNPAALSGAARDVSKWPLVVRARSSGSPCRCARRPVPGDHFDEAATQEGFAAGQPDLGDAEADKDGDQAQVLLDGEFGILRPDLAGSAVDALVIAAIGDGDAEVVNDAAMAVCEAGIESHRGGIGKSGGGHRGLQKIGVRGQGSGISLVDARGAFAEDQASEAEDRDDDQGNDEVIGHGVRPAG